MVYDILGVVTYNIFGFVDKNNDLLFRDFKECMCKSSNDTVRNCYPKDELDVGCIADAVMIV